MGSKKKSKTSGKTNSTKKFGDTFLNQYPDLKDALKPSDQYPELQQALKTRSNNLPVGSISTKIIISEGEIVKRIYETPKGEIISLFKNQLLNQAA